VDTPRPSPRTNRTRRVPHPVPQANFHLSSAEWLAVAVNATLPDATGLVPAPELRLYRWDTGNCSDPATCPVALGLYDALPIAACESVVHFRAGGRDFVMYGGERLLAAVTFTSLAELSGTRLTPPPPRTKWTRRVPHLVLIGHAASLTPYAHPAGARRFSLRK